jgi:hypothetical protein
VDLEAEIRVFDAAGALGLVNYAPPREWGATVRYNW